MESSSEARPRIYALAWGFYLILALAGIAWMGWRGDLGWRAFLSPASWLRDLGAGLMAGAGLVAVWRIAGRYVAAAQRLERRLAELLGDVRRDEILGLALMSGIAEETFFRGGVQGSWGWLWATALFAVLHTGPGPSFRMWTLFAAIAGLVFAGLTEWTGNLLAPVVAHVVVNGINLTLLAGDRPPD